MVTGLTIQSAKKLKGLELYINRDKFILHRFSEQRGEF